MLTKVQDLVKANGFIKGFSSITADSNADQALLYTGKAAMMLHGGWTYGSMKADGGDFVSGGSLGYMNFPPVEGGKGDPSNTVGNPGQYLSISVQGHRRAEGDREEVLRHRRCSTDDETKAWIDDRRRCRSSRAPTAQFAASPDADVPQVRLRHLGQRQGLRPVLGPGAAARPRPRCCWTTSPSCSSCRSRPQQWVDNMNGVIGK